MVINYKDVQFDIDILIRKSDGDTILYLHGLGTSKEDFEQATKFQALDDFNLVTFDFPGCGMTKADQYIQLTIDDLVSISNEVVNKLGLENFHLAGHSMGGLTGLFYAIKFSDRVKTFINVEGNLDPIDCRVFSKFVSTYPSLGSKEDFFRDFSDHVRVSENSELDIFLNHIEKKVSFNSLKDYCKSIVYHCESSPLMRDFIALECPKLFIYGQENNDLTYLDHLSSNGVKVCEIPGSNHFPFYSNPEYFFNSISKFVRNKTNVL